MAYHMAALAMTLNDLESYFFACNLLNSRTSGSVACIIYDVFIHVGLLQGFSDLAQIT